MRSATLDLPTGLRGRVLALGLLFVVLALVWVAAVEPLLGWYTERADQLARRHTLASRMEEVVAALPGLRSNAARTAAAPGPQALLEGGSDALAGAALQAQLETMAANSGTSVSSLELLPAAVAGSYRQIGLRVSVSGPWPALVRMLAAVQEANPRMLVDDLQLQPAPSLAAGAAQPLAAAFTIIAFRAGGG